MNIYNLTIELKNIFFILHNIYLFIFKYYVSTQNITRIGISMSYPLKNSI